MNATMEVATLLVHKNLKDMIGNSQKRKKKKKKQVIQKYFSAL